MNLKKLFTLLMVIGAMVIIVGGVKWAINQPKQFNPAESQQTILGRNDLGNLLNVKMENYQRKRKRGDATTIMIVGGLIVLLAGILRVSIKEPTLVTGSSSSPQSLNQKGFHYCTNCGAKVRDGYQCSYCNSN